MGDENNEKTVKTCPFSGEGCIEEKCALWTEIGVMAPGMIAPQKQGMCALAALVLLTGSPRPQMIQQGAKLRL